MRVSKRWIGLGLVVGIAACQEANGPAGNEAKTAPGLAVDASGSVGAVPSATGGGYYSLAGLRVQFALSAIQSPGGTAQGEFHHQVDEGGGVTIDFHGSVTCLAVDPINHRAWIGGVITQNASTDPGYQGDIQQPGRDIWFRVLDGGDGAGTGRTTFTGFQGSAGIQTSAEYCSARPWPAGNARTWPVVDGTITVRP